MDQTPVWKNEWQKDTVYLHVLPRQIAKCIPNLSPFAIKLETWLRIQKLPYEIVDFQGFSTKKRQSPFILFNEQEIPDSNFIIEYLAKYFKIEQNEGLSVEQKAVSRFLIKMIEENTSWSVFWYRYVRNTSDYRENGLNFTGTVEEQDDRLSNIQESVRDRAWKHGIGRHDDDEIYKIGSDDIRAVSAYLGEKPYLFGNKPHLADCTLFGVIIQITDVPLNFPMKRVIKEECPNIPKFVKRMKENYWPHWDQQFL